jgi:hypothetical protein
LGGLDNCWRIAFGSRIELYLIDTRDGHVERVTSERHETRRIPILMYDAAPHDPLSRTAQERDARVEDAAEAGQELLLLVIDGQITQHDLGFSRQERGLDFERGLVPRFKRIAQPGKYALGNDVQWSPPSPERP